MPFSWQMGERSTMSPDELTERLSRIKAHWSEVLRAHQGQPEAMTAAQQELLLRYHGAVYRYLLGMLREPDAAQELAQDFAVRFLRGDFRRADPQRGRFRDFVKTALRHLVLNHWGVKRRQRERGPQALPEQVAEPASPESVWPDSDRAFAAACQEELLARAWAGLARVQEETGAPYHAVLHYRVKCPKARSALMAEQLGTQLGKSFTADAIRQLLARARKKFADLLVEEVALSLETDDPFELERELIDLNLLSYCQTALQRRQSST
jgi:DNA-directed RNA polymerase specialized sigma24 family protein